MNQADTKRETAPRSPSRFRKHLVYALKLVVTTALIVVIVRHVDLDEFLDAVRQMNWHYVAASLALLFTGVVVSTFKWRQLLLVHNVQFGLAQLLRWYLVGTFVGSFLPSTIGGDGYRIYKTMSNPRSKTSAVLAVFVERISGLLAMVMLGYVAAISAYLHDQHTLAYGFATIGTIVLVGALVAVVAALYGKLGRRLLAVKFVPNAIKTFIDHAGEYKGQPIPIVVTMLLSFLFHSIRIASAWLILRGLGVEIRVDQLAMVATITPMIAMIPISLNGWGLQEGSMLFLLQQFGVPSAVALAVPLIIRVNMTCITLLGGVIYIFESGKDKTVNLSGRSMERVVEEQQEAMRQAPPAHRSKSGMEE